MKNLVLKQFINSLLLGFISIIFNPSDSYAVVFTEDTYIAHDNFDYDGNAIRVESGVLTIDGTHHFDWMILTNDSVLTHSEGSPHQLDLDLAEGFQIRADAKIDISGKGNTFNSDADLITGGSYGGKGSGYLEANSNDTYGSESEPVDLGTGGRGNSQSQTSRGGGAIIIRAPDFDLYGQIIADGDSLHSGGIGGGSGGSVLIYTRTVSEGKGHISAKGGTGDLDNHGGGGRVAIHHERENNPVPILPISIDVSGGGDGAGQGTIYLKNFLSDDGVYKLHNYGSETQPFLVDENIDPSLVLDIDNSFLEFAQPVSNTDIRIKNSTVTFENEVVTNKLDIEASDITFESKWTITANEELRLWHTNLDIQGEWISPENQNLYLDGSNLKITLVNNYERHWNNIDLRNGSNVDHQDGYSDSVGLKGIHWVANSVYIDASSQIDISDDGILFNESAGLISGGSYGGIGAGDSNNAYGNLFDPVDYGTGGRGNDDAQSTRGGGVFHLVANSLVLNGSILADGESADEPELGGGSGGSIYIDVGQLNGFGEISAQGGSSDDGIDGAGGRIAVYYSAINEGDVLDFNDISARSGGSNATPGTTYIKNKNTLQTDIRFNGEGTDTDPIYIDEGIDENTNLYLDEVNVIVGSEVSGRIEVLSNAEVFFEEPVSSDEIVIESSQVVFDETVTADYISIDDSEVIFEESWTVAQDQDLEFEDSFVEINGEWTHPSNRDLRLINSELIVGLDNNSERLWNNIYLEDDSILSHDSAEFDYPGISGLTWQANEIHIDEDSEINVNGKGYPNHELAELISGGSHAGKGSGNSNTTYGDAFIPSDYGTGGMGSDGSNYTRGGGVVNLTANLLELRGEINANGEHEEGENLGGGSGGSVYINVDRLVGDGGIYAEGAGSDNDIHGGGGRIAVYFNSVEENDDITDYSTRSGGENASPGTTYIKNKDTLEQHFLVVGESVDTEAVIVDKPLDENTLLFIDEANAVVTEQCSATIMVVSSAKAFFELPVNSDYIEVDESTAIFQDTVDAIEIYPDNDAQLVFENDLTAEYFTYQNSHITTQGKWMTNQDEDLELEFTVLDIQGEWIHPFQRDLSLINSELHVPLQNNQVREWNSINLEENSLLSHQLADRDAIGLNGIQWLAEYIIIDDTSKIDLTAKGYLFDENAGNFSGGSYGGSGYGLSNPVYGDQYEPLDYGTGGKELEDNPATRGGGVIYLKTETLDLHGQIISNGENASGTQTGAGSGGSIYITAKNLTGTGLVFSNGGVSEDINHGGGGRIAIYYGNKDDVTDLSKYTSAAGGNTADAGTVHHQQIDFKTAVADSTASGFYNQQQTSFTVSFINQIALDSFTIDDILLQRDLQTIAIQEIVPVDATQFQINLTEPLADGDYDIYIGPNIFSRFGYGMDQDDDGTNLEPDEDKFHSSFTVDTIKPVTAVISSHVVGEVINTPIFVTTISGSREDDTRVLINGEEVVAMGTGDWVLTDYALQEGLNILQIVLEDEAGNQSDIIELQINARDPDLVPPVITAFAPLGVFNQMPQKITVAFEEENFDESQSGISVSYNNTVIASGGVVVDNKFELDLPSDLSPGEYLVDILLQDEDGNQAQDNFGIYYLEQYPYQNIVRVGASYEHSTIQSAIDAAQIGDLILIEEGEYNEPVTVNKLVHLKGNSDDPANVVLTYIDGAYGEHAGSLEINLSEALPDKNTPIILEGFTIKSNPSHSWHQALKIVNTHAPVVVSKMMLETSNGNSYTMAGPENDTGSGAITYVVNSYLFRGYATFTNLHADNLYLVNSELSESLSVYSSSYSLKLSDFVLTATENYGINYGTELLVPYLPLSIDQSDVEQSPLAAIDDINVYFSLNINPATFTADDISITGPTSPLIASIEQVSASSFTIHFNEALDTGTYILTIGPNIEDGSANIMDQNGNRQPGEADDSYQISFTIDNENPLQPSINAYGLSPQINRININTIELSGAREDNTAIYINDVEIISLGSGEWSISDYPLNEGLNTLTVFAEDGVGNRSLPYDVILSVDSVAPIVGAISPTGYQADAVEQMNIEYTEEDSEIDWDGSEILVTDSQANAVSYTLTDNGDHFVILFDSPLNDDSYDLSLRLRDTHGNRSEIVNAEVIVDTQEPDAPQLDSVPTITQIQSLQITGNKETDAVILFEGEVVYSDSGNQWSHTVTLEPGENTLSFSQRDSSGNISPEATVSVTFDNVAPGPVSVSANGADNGSRILLDWSSYDEFNNGADIARYDIYISDSSFTSVASLTPSYTTNAGEQELAIESLTLGSSYYIAVVAVDNLDNAETQVSSTAVTISDIIAPELVSEISLQSYSDSLIISWTDETPAADLSHYSLDLNGQSTVTIPAGTLTHTFNGLTSSTAYTINLIAVDGSDNQSNAVSLAAATTVDNPNDVSGEVENGNVILSWTPPADSAIIANYIIYVSESEFSTLDGMTPRATIYGSETSAIIAGLKNNQDYYFAVTTVNISDSHNTAINTVMISTVIQVQGPEISSVNMDSLTLVDNSVITHSGTLSVSASHKTGLSNVQYYLDDQLLGNGTLNNQGASLYWDIADTSDGAHQLKIVVYDSLSNQTEISLNIEVAMAAPTEVPQISSDSAGQATNKEQVNVELLTTPNGQIQLYRNGEIFGSLLQADVNGQLTTPVTLLVGENQYTASAVNRGGSSDQSDPIIITYDDAIPAAPSGVIAKALTDGVVEISWQTVNDNSVAGYNIYRSDSAFSQIADAQKINNELLSVTQFDDLPLLDATYYYRISSENQLGTESELSSQVNATSDSTAPQASLVEYISDGLVDPETGAMAAGHISVKVHVSEPLLTTPFFSLTPEYGVPKIIVLSKINTTLYQGQFEITSDTASGIAYAIFSARDVLGNRGTEIVEGSSIKIDADGPTVVALSITPEAPINNDPPSGEGAPPANTVVVNFTLEDPIKVGTSAQLHYLLSGPGRGLTEITNLVAEDDTHYSGSFELPTDAGLTEVEGLSFQLTAIDSLDNPAEHIKVPNNFQIYQGDLPPLEIPKYLAAQALPAGQVQLSWEVVEDAAEYQIYRQDPAAEGEPPAELLPLHRTADLGWVDTAPADGEYLYAISSIRQANQQEGESAVSETVSVTTDATVPPAPQDLLVTLIPQGIKGEWTTLAEAQPDSEPVTYRVYRAVQQPISDVSTLTPIYEHLGDGLFIDSNPSDIEHAYVVTAVDQVGNESPPSNTEYKNFGLLPVSEFHVLQEEGTPPQLNWVHHGADIVGFELALLSVVDGNDITEALHGGLLVGDNFTDSQYMGQSRYYQIIAVDAQDERSIARRILLPELQITPLTNSLKRAVMNIVELQIENRSDYPVEQLRVMTEVNGIEHHSNQAVNLDSGASVTIPVVIGGYADLANSVDLKHSIILEPNSGESIIITQHQTVSVTNAAMALSVEAVNMTRGATGEVSFTLENNSDSEIEMVVAKRNNSRDSDEIHIQFHDQDNNLLADYPFRQTVGNHVVTLSNGTSVLRIAPHESVTSAPYTIDVPDTSIDEGRITLTIDKFHYHYGQHDAVQINGMSRSQTASLQQSPYYAQIDSITPSLSHGDEDIVISGQAFKRSDNSPQANVTLVLYIRNNGFERSNEILSDSSGLFSYTFTPLPGESGQYSVSVLHPAEHSRPVHGEFTIQQVNFSPSIYNLSLPRNKPYTLYIKVDPGKALDTSSLRLEYLDADQPAAKPAGIGLTLPSPTNISAGSSANLAVTFSASGEAPQSGTLVLRINSDEYNPDNPDNPQSIGLFTLNYQLVESLPSLYFSPNYLETGLAQEQLITETITLENRGLGSMDEIHLSLLNEQEQTLGNSWINIITPRLINQLQPGQSSAVRLGINPGTNIVDGVYSFKLRVQSANHPTRDINIFVSVTQSGDGQVLFKISDIYTATLNENNQPIPGLQGARIHIQNELVPGIEYSLTSDELGEAWFTEIPPGFYRYRATATNHSETSGRVSIKPGITLNQDVFMDYNLISVQWEVNEITLEDRYEIVLHTEYEVNVPAAVVVASPGSVTLPEMEPGQIYNGEFKLTNHGLIRADNLAITLPEDDAYFNYELMQNIPTSIGAQQTITIPYRITSLQKLVDADGNATGGGCSSYGRCTGVEYSYDCANGTQTKGGTRHCTSQVYGSCESSQQVYSSGTDGNEIINKDIRGGGAGGYSYEGGGGGNSSLEGAKCIGDGGCDKSCCSPGNSGGGGSDGGSGGNGPSPSDGPTGIGPTFGTFK